MMFFVYTFAQRHKSVSVAAGGNAFMKKILSLIMSLVLTFSEAALFDGTYRIVFEMSDAMGNTAYSDPVQFDVANGEILTTVFMD